MKQGGGVRRILEKVWDVLYPTVAIVLCMLIVTVVGIMAAGQITGRPGLDSRELLAEVRSLPLWINVGFYSLTLISQRKRYALDVLRFQPENRRWSAGKLLAACLFAAALGHLLSTGIAASGFSEIFSGYTDQAAAAFEGQNLLLLTAATVILAPLAEEMIFRGMTYRRARSYLGPAGGALISAALFGVYHGNMVQFLYAFVMGLLFAAFCEKSGSILPAVLGHGAANLWAIASTPAMERLSLAAPQAVLWVSAAEAVVGVVCAWLLFRGKKKTGEGGKKDG